MTATRTSPVTPDVESPAPRSRPRRRAWLRWPASNLLFIAPGALLIGVMSIYPIFILLQMSISKVDITNIVGAWPLVGTANFTSIFASNTFREVTVQTLVFVVFVLLATMLAGLIVALMLRSSRGFSLVTQTTLILVWTLPPVVVGALWKFLLSSDGAINELLVAVRLVDEPVPFLSLPETGLIAIGAVTVWISVPFAGLVIKSAILDVPEEILDAARVDGASKAQVLNQIVLPMIRPTLLILGVLTVVAAFKAFDLIYTMTRGGPGSSSSTIPFLGYTMAFQNYEFGRAAAISVVAMFIVLCLAVAYIFAVRREEK